MKSFAKHIIAFLGFSSLMYLILIFVWGSVMPAWLNSNLIYKQRDGHLYSRLAELNKYQNVDTSLHVTFFEADSKVPFTKPLFL